MLDAFSVLQGGHCQNHRVFFVQTKRSPRYFPISRHTLKTASVHAGADDDTFEIECLANAVGDEPACRNDAPSVVNTAQPLEFAITMRHLVIRKMQAYAITYFAK